MEMQAAETLGSVLWEVDGMDWEFYYDIARHCYDECRHCKMGEERVRELGHEIHEFPQFVGNYAWRQIYDPMRRYAMLTYIIEQDSFALKHETYKNYVQLNDHASAEAILYDIIDETMHVRWGTKWVGKLMEHQKEPFPSTTSFPNVAKPSSITPSLLPSDLLQKSEWRKSSRSTLYRPLIGPKKDQ